MIVFPNAKINIGLNIVNKRPDGYHDIETVFYPIDLCDCLEFVENSDGIDQLEITGAEIVCQPNDNLVIKALNILRQDFEIPALKIHLAKKIPTGAGLGGGSSDAAFMLKALNNNFNLGLTNENLTQKAATLGSDCAFFITNTPSFATGRGDIFTPINKINADIQIMAFKPKFSISTPTAYKKVKPQKPKASLTESFLLPVEKWKELIKNDFEQFLFPDYPELLDLKNRLYNCGAIYASMTGSGSAMFGIFKKGDIVLDKILDNIRIL